MRKVKFVSKKLIIKALMEENLGPGHFVEVNEERPLAEVSKDPECKVCAVGAVLRHAGFSNKKIFNFGNDLSINGPAAYVEYKEIPSLLEEGYYINALSVKYESLVQQYGINKKTVNKVITWVKKKFPERIVLLYKPYTKS